MERTGKLCVCLFLSESFFLTDTRCESWCEAVEVLKTKNICSCWSMAGEEVDEQVLDTELHSS